MDINQKLHSLLIKSGLKQDEAKFYIFVLENKGCSIADIHKKTNLSRSNAYRAFEILRSLELLKSNSRGWKTNLQPVSLKGLIRKLENRQRNAKQIINELKIINTARTLTIPSEIPNIETFKAAKVFEKYHDLSKMDFSNVFVFGNWEEFNYHTTENIVNIERQFVKNRLKNGGKAHIFLTNDGPYTHEITDHDVEQNRKTRHVENIPKKPILISAFDNNNLVYIWNLNEAGKIYSTLIDSKSVADFYKEFMYSYMN